MSAEVSSLVSRWRSAALAIQLMCALWARSAPLSAADDAEWTAAVRPLLQNYCWECHGAEKKKGDLNLESIASAADLDARADALAEIEKRLASSEMPPARAKQPSEQERSTLVRWIRARMAHGQPQIAGDPGTVVIPHLTPTQYERSVHDLTGIRLPVAALLPREGGSGEGFDNVGSAQTMTTMHLQAYLSTAKLVVKHARILPELPIEWREAINGVDIRTTDELYAEIASTLVSRVDWMWREQTAQHLATLKPLLPSDDEWGRSVGDMYQSQWGWLIVYLHAAWEYRFRAELGHPEWSPADVAAAYQPPLRAEILGRLVSVLEAKSRNCYWNQIVSRWQALPPPPMSDKEVRAQCFAILKWCMRHMLTVNFNPYHPQPESIVLLPFEVDPATWLTQPDLPLTVMQTEGRRPFRFKLDGRQDLYLLTTDAGDGSDDDVMIWEHGIITRNGQEEPWTAVTVRDGADAPVEWGSHPMGAVANLPKDSIAVHAPAVLHLTFPAGTTAFRVDARADPVFAKNGSMQAVPCEHLPSGDDLHFVFARYVIGAPGSKRQAYLLAARHLDSLNAYKPVFDPWNLLPKEVQARWGKGQGDWGSGYYNKVTPPPLESVYGADFPHEWPGVDMMWKGSSTYVLQGATPADLKAIAHITDQLRGTFEARDELMQFLVRQQAHLDSAADALTVVPAGMSPEAAEKHQRLLDAARADEARLLKCARMQLTDFAEKAWRRMPPEPSLTALLKQYQQGRDEGLCYEASMKRALTGIFVSPYFLYRGQQTQQRDTPYPLSGGELADRLASVLWGSIPDAELRQAGASGQLGTADGLRQQIQRMIADRRSQALATEFAGQMLLFTGFDTFSGPDKARFPQFTPSVRDAMYQEILCFFSNLFTQDRPLTDIVDANYTFVNQELADFYGINGVTGPEFRKIAVNPAQRGGVLGMGAFLVGSSLPLRSSPIKRGNWVLTYLLGTPPPPPPPVVPNLSHEDSDEQKLTIVQQMKRHRTDALCMSCHERIDPLGVALESFDGIGRRRAKLQDGSAVNEQETTVDGTLLKGFSGLKSYLMSDPQRSIIMRSLCRRFVGYALGRGLIPSDEELIDQLMTDLAGNGWRSSTLVLDVLTSPEFTRRRDETPSKSATLEQTQEKP